MKTRFIVVALISLISAVGLTVGKAIQQPRSRELSSSDALRIIRTIDTAEASGFHAEQNYLSLDQLVRQRLVSADKVGLALSDSSSGTIKNYKVSVVVSTDGKHYAAALVPSDGCGTALFTGCSPPLHLPIPIHYRFTEAGRSCPFSRRRCTAPGRWA
jgi:hypothetical protein